MLRAPVSYNKYKAFSVSLYINDNIISFRCKTQKLNITYRKVSTL